MLPDASLQRFVRALLNGQSAVRDGGVYRSADGRQAPSDLVMELVSAGALSGDQRGCRANSATLPWLKRARLDEDAFAAQHRLVDQRSNGIAINLLESPLARLASGDAAFLGRHHVEAGDRVRKLVERAQLQPRMTMTYSGSRTAGNRPQAASDISDLAADARASLAELHRLLPPDCAGVVMDVCGMLKGLQEVERDRAWPRRSAKLVLRIGLEQLAQHFGIGPFAIGKASRRPRNWMDADARPDQFG